MESEMTSKTLKSVVGLTLVASAVALAAPGGSPGGPGGGSGGGGGPPDGKGNKPTSEVSNSLSVPAIMAGAGSTFAINCPNGLFSALVPPATGTQYYDEECAPSKDEGGPICVAAGNYYVQRDAAWQAPCMTGGSGISVMGKWGDNLAGGSASLKVGSPIRVEFLLLDASNASLDQTGYFVIKLEPTELDRESDYGHLATGPATDGSAAIPYVVGAALPDGSTFPAIVFDPTARLKIERIVDDVPVNPAVYNGAASGEINATGKIVYGYNLRVQVAGTYRITYTFPRITFAANCIAGTCSGSEAVLNIVVAGSGGGGGGKPIKP
jgi:hypothetical protein